MVELANCELCGKVFVQSSSPICPSCRLELEKKFEIVWQFIRKRENREATVNDICEATGVEEKLVFQWIQEGRLQVKDFKNLFYPCELCGTPIKEGKICTNCKSGLAKDLEQVQKEEEINQNSRARTYFTK